MPKLVAVVVLLSLAGCSTPAQLAAKDDAKCQSYGSRPGDPAYAQCRAQLDAARTQARATRSAAGAFNIE